MYYVIVNNKTFEFKTLMGFMNKIEKLKKQGLVLTQKYRNISGDLVAEF